MSILFLSYTFHCTWVTAEAYSSPSIVLSARSPDGGRMIFDDFREAYYWLRMNTPEVSIVNHFFELFQMQMIKYLDCKFKSLSKSIDINRQWYIEQQFVRKLNKKKITY